MKTIEVIATTKKVVWDSGLGPLPYLVRCRLVEHAGRLTFDIGRRGRRPSSIQVPRLHPYDYPLWLTSVIARRCKVIPEKELKAYQQHLWTMMQVPQPIVTICFGSWRDAQDAQQLHLFKAGLVIKCTGAVLQIEGRAAGEKFSPTQTRQWNCSIQMADTDEVKRLQSLIESANHRVVEFNDSTVGIRASNSETWLSVGYSMRQIQTFARYDGVKLQKTVAPNDITLAFRAAKRIRVKS